MERLVGQRFATLLELKEAIQSLVKEKITAFIDVGKPTFAGMDNEILIEFDEEKQFTLWYLRDNAKNYYITEVQ